MSASAKLVEKVLKSFLTIALSFMLCPLVLVERAQAEESSPIVTTQDEDESPIVSWTTSGTCEWMIDVGGRLTIRPISGDSGKMAPFSSNPWTGKAISITSVEVKPGVSIPSASGLFSGCTSLLSADLSGLDTSEVTDMSSMFAGCSSLAALDVSGWDTSGVTDMGWMFAGCSSLAALDVSGWDTSGVTDMSWMFNNCKSLTSLDLSSFNVSEVTNMSYMFRDCGELSLLSVSGWNASKVVDASWMFYDCAHLVSLDLSGWDTVSLTNISHMFGACSNLASLNLSGLNTKKVEDSDEFFYGCGKLHSVEIGETVGFNNDNGQYLFRLPMPKGKGLTGKWVKAGDPSGTSYFAGRVPDKVSAHYYAQGSLTPGAFSIDSASETYTGSAITKKIESDLVEGVDYTAVYESNVDSGTAYVSIVGAGGCTGELQKLSSFTIEPKEITADMISPIDAQAWTGSQITPHPVVTYNGKTLEEGSDYTISYDDNIQPGEGTITIAGNANGNFRGSVTVKFAIEQKVSPTPSPSPQPFRYAIAYHLDGGVNADSNPSTYAAGSKTELAAPTKSGYEFLGWFTDAAFTKQVTAVETYQTGDVELWAKWAKLDAETFPDVDRSAWYAPGVEFVQEKSLMTGYGDTGLFGVGKTLTRGELATILWRHACPNEVASYDPATAKDETSIKGSADGQFYTAAANWAVKNGIITGYIYEDGTQDFAANNPVTFEQLITILARFATSGAGADPTNNDLSAFADGSEASSWAAPSLKWAADNSLVEGYPTSKGKVLAPTENVLRERVAVVLMRAFKMGILG